MEHREQRQRKQQILLHFPLMIHLHPYRYRKEVLVYLGERVAQSLVSEVSEVSGVELRQEVEEFRDTRFFSRHSHCEQG